MPYRHPQHSHILVEHKHTLRPKITTGMFLFLFTYLLQDCDDHRRDDEDLSIDKQWLQCYLLHAFVVIVSSVDISNNSSYGQAEKQAQ